jgi:hypothetical protein
MMKIKECPRCKKGYIALDRDQYGWYEYCIQCGYLHDLESMFTSVQQRYNGVRENDKKAIALNK